MSNEWWRESIPGTEEVLWFGQPDQGFFPARYGWAYMTGLVGLGALWLASPWIFETARDFWKLACISFLVTFTMWADRYVRAQRVYVVTTRNAWEINKSIKSKTLEINRFLRFHKKRRAVDFARHPFFSFDHLSDPDAALEALHQAQEASK